MIRLSYFSKILFIIIFQFWNCSGIYSQPFTNDLKAKLPRPDQYKLMKAETFIAQGNSILSKDSSLKDIIASKNEKRLDEYYSNRIKASYCFRNGNGLFFEVCDKQIKAFWKNYQGDKMALTTVSRIENATYDSLIKADRLRAIAENKTFIEDVVPLVSKAEAIESGALLRLQKLLYVYLNWPKEPNIPWLLSNVQDVHGEPGTSDLAQVNNQKEVPDSLDKKASRLASNLYGSMNLSSDQVNKFNEFLKKNYSKKGEANTIDFDKLYNTVIDSLHKQWHLYQTFGNILTDTVKTSPFTRKNLTKAGSDTKNTGQVIYKIQIAASQKKLNQTDLKAIYTGNNKVDESVENGEFKYTIGSYSTFDSAVNFSNQIHVKEAKIVAVPVN